MVYCRIDTEDYFICFHAKENGRWKNKEVWQLRDMDNARYCFWREPVGTKIMVLWPCQGSARNPVPSLWILGQGDIHSEGLPLHATPWAPLPPSGMADLEAGLPLALSQVAKCYPHPRKEQKYREWVNTEISSIASMGNSAWFAWRWYSIKSPYLLTLSSSD